MIWQYLYHSENSVTIRESRKGALRVVLCTKKLHFVSRNLRVEISSVACGFSSTKIDYSDYPKSLISRINEVYVFFNKISLQRYFIEKKINFTCHSNRLFCCNHTYCVNIVSVTSVSRYITPASRYHPRRQSRFSQYIRGLIPQNFAELAETVPIATLLDSVQVCN